MPAVLCPARFVFCDQGTKKHPKIYGFSSAQAAARAFDLLTCKRALEKSHSVQSVLGCTQVSQRPQGASAAPSPTAKPLQESHSSGSLWRRAAGLGSAAAMRPASCRSSLPPSMQFSSWNHHLD